MWFAQQLQQFQLSRCFRLISLTISVGNSMICLCPYLHAVNGELSGKMCPYPNPTLG